MKNLYLDESGYTGFDLLNKQQPFQGASSVLIREEDAKSLIQEYFPKLQSKELKHRSLSRRKNNWDKLLEFQKIILDEYMGITYVCNKRYLLILMFLDSCVEPFFYDQNINFFQNGQNYSLASLLYYAAPKYWGDKNFEDLLFLFQQAEKSKSDISVSLLTEKAKTLIGRKLSENLYPLAMRYKSCIDEIKNNKSSTDAAFIVLVSLITHIEKFLNDKYKIIHDESKNLSNYNAIIKNLISHTAKQSFYATKLTTLNFPLKLSDVSQEKSHLSYGVQLADVLIGGVIEFCTSSAGLVDKNNYNQRILELYSDHNIIHLLPSINFEEDKDFRCGTQGYDIVEYMAKNFS